MESHPQETKGGAPSFFSAKLLDGEFSFGGLFLGPIVIRMALGAAPASGIVARAAIFMAIAAGCNSGQQDVGGVATLRRARVARGTCQQPVGVVVELGVLEPARRDGRLRHGGQRLFGIGYFPGHVVSGQLLSIHYFCRSVSRMPKRYSRSLRVLMPA